MLEKFKNEKEEEVRALSERALPPVWADGRPDFCAALESGDTRAPLAVIAEYKIASPSKGIICRDVPVESAVGQYAENGAKAISVLTEKKWFLGDMDFLYRAREALDGKAVPLLRKDFIFHPLQVRATASSPASALLLIVGLEPDYKRLGALRELAESFGMEAVVEAFDLAEVAIARKSGARIIQINARNLNSLKVDREACLGIALSARPRNSETWIAASGMENRRHLEMAARAGYRAALAGTALMAGGTPGASLARLREFS